MAKKEATLIVFLLLIAFVHAEVIYKDIYTKDFKNSGILTADKLNFSITVISPNEYDEVNNQTRELYKLKIIFPNGRSTILSYNQTVQDYPYIVQFVSIKNGADKEFNITSQKYSLYSSLKIQKAEESLVLTRKFAKTTFRQGEPVKVDVTISNKGSATANVTYSDPFPSNFSITDAVGLGVIENSIYWKGQIAVGKEYPFSYTINGADPGKFTSKATLGSTSGNKTNSQTLIVDKAALTIITNFTSSNIQVGDTILMTVSFTNSDKSYDISGLIYDLYVPDSFEVIAQTGGSSHIIDYWHHTSDLPALENETLTFTLTAQKQGIAEITAKGGYTFKASPSRKEIFSQTRTFNITLVPLDVLLQKKGASYFIRIVNPNQKLTFSDIHATISGKETVIAQLGSLNGYDLITLPQGENSATVSLVYHTKYGETLSHVYALSAADKTGTNTSSGSGGVGGLQGGSGSGGAAKGISAIPFKINLKPYWFAVILGVVTFILLILYLLKRHKENKMLERLH